MEYNKELEKEEVTEDKEERTEIFGQMSIEEMCMEELRSLYEEMKIATAEGTLREVYAHKLIKNR